LDAVAALVAMAGLEGMFQLFPGVWYGKDRQRAVFDIFGVASLETGR